MDIEFKNLTKLQEIDAELIEVSHFLKDVPSQIQAVDTQIEESFEIVSRAKNKLTTNQKKRRDLEAGIQDTKAQVTKYKRQLGEVKTNREYTSLLHEIEEAEKKADDLEEEIISEMLQADDIEEEIMAATQKADVNKERFTKEKEVLFQKKAEKEEQKKELMQEKEDLLPKIPADQIALYEKIASKNSGIALSPITEEFCSMCHMRIRPQVLNELKAANSIILCENCGRILHI